MSLTDTLTNTVGAADPTGIISAAGAAVGLVGTVLRAVPALKNAQHAIKGHSSSVSGPSPLHRAHTAVPASEVIADPERERRAYETVNFVLRELGSRICAAGLVDEHALSRALTSAAQHIDFNLFSGDANRLFASLAPKLGDSLLVNSVFTSIYFIGALTAELTRSLPNYKESYVPLGPRIVQQLFRTAIGEDAFRENLTGNLDAYKTLATTAGLLRPTDIGYSAFPGFPAFSPCRYSSRAYSDVRNNKVAYEKLVKHFDKYGFPQPVLARQAEVGKIKEWRFIAGDAPSRAFEVERADKTIGESFGRVLHWLICSADRLPPGQAIIVYYDQHIELVKWIGHRMGYSVLSSRTELDWSGNHLQLDKKMRAISDTWVILMPSENAQAARRASSAQWTQMHVNIAVQPTHIQDIPSQVEHKPHHAALSPPAPEEDAMPPVVSPVSPTPSASASAPPQATTSQVPSRKQSNAKTIDQRLDDVERDFNNVLLPQCNKFLGTTYTDQKTRDTDYHRLTQHIERGLIAWLDGFPIPENHPARNRRKAMIVHAQQVLEALDRGRKSALLQHAPFPDAVELGGSLPAAAAAVLPTPVANSPDSAISLPHNQPTSVASPSPPPYSTVSPPSKPGSANTSALPFPEKPPPKPVVRRKAPPPPRRFVSAKALYDFEPEAGNEEELAIKEGDEIDIIEKTAVLEEEGWCRARVKGQKKIGLVPLEYLETEHKPPIATSASPNVPTSVQANVSTTHQSPNASPGSQASYSDAPLLTNPSAFASSSHAMINSHSPPTHMQYYSPPAPANKLGKKLEVAGLGVATVGAAAGVITVFQGEDQSGNTKKTDFTSNNPEQLQTSSAGYQQSNANTHARNQGSRADNDQNTDAPDQNAPLSAPDDNNPPSPVMDLSAFTSPPFEPQTISTESNPVAPFTTVDPYFNAQNTDPAGIIDPVPASAPTPGQDSVATSNTFTPMNPLAPLTTPDSVVSATAPEYYSSPVATPIASPNLIAEDSTVDVVAFSQLSTEDIVDDNDEMAGAIATADDFDDGYDS